jgi:hypothetical protein
MHFHRSTKLAACSLGEGVLKRDHLSVDAIERDSLLAPLDGTKALQSRMVLLVH